MNLTASPETHPAHAPAIFVDGQGVNGVQRRVRPLWLSWMADGRAIPVALAAVAFLVVSPSLLNRFVEWDDYINLFENRSYRGLGWTQLRWMLTNTLMGHYIPVSWLTFGLDYTLWGMNPLGYHLTNNLLHAANAALVYLVGIRVLARATTLSGAALRGAAAVAALFFALHPLRAESVAWATERRDVLSGFFFLLTILLYLKALDREAPRRRLLAGSVVSYALALLSKSIVMTLPLVLLLLDVYPLRRLRLGWDLWRDGAARAVLREKLPYVALGLAGALIAFWAVASNDFLTPVHRYGWPARIAITAFSFWFYLEKTILPVALTPLYELPAIVRPLDPRFLWSGVAVLAISAALVGLRRRWPAGLAVWAYYGIVLGPVCGLVHAGHQLAHDRYSYLSCLGWALLVGGAAGVAARAAAARAVKPWLARCALGAVGVWLLTLAMLTWYQVQIWRDTETLWRHAVEHDPHCGICQSNLGHALFRQDLFLMAQAQFERALALRPDHAKVHANLGAALQAMGQYAPAIEQFNKALARYPRDPDILTNLAVVYLNQKRHADALPILETAYQIDPDFFATLVNLGITLVEMGRPQEGLTHLLHALEQKPDEPVVHFDLARAYLTLGDHAAARKEYDLLVTMDPRRAKALEPAFSSVW